MEPPCGVFTCICPKKALYPGGLRPGRRAPGDFAEEGAFQNIFFTEICLRILILLNPFFCVFLETFSSGGVPPDAPGGVKVGLGGASYDQMCFFIDF